MEWFWIIAATGGSGFVVKWWRDRQDTRRNKAEELEGVRRLAGEDARYLHEQLHRLDREIGGQVLDAETRVAYRTALDSCESAQRTLDQISNAEEVSKVTEILAAGLYALACAQARLAGRPLPEQRVVCFFDPLHGPSVTEVLWTRSGHGSRRVPACSMDADRVTNNLLPEVRTVKAGTRTRPYWAAGSAFLPYAEGYFAGVAALSWALHPAAFEAAPETGRYFRTASAAAGAAASVAAAMEPAVGAAATMVAAAVGAAAALDTRGGRGPRESAATSRRQSRTPWSH